ncbi:GtrA family protein [Streptomyces sp. TP-A0874]|uniref:GtrA family protein n=1 Tax=Streptomyces sp. TP-A0874 TaxID=549819 RepID=UPI00099F9B4E|nr:GtrA family protein [Streptomyces sp. TP-A0874]
MGEERTLRSRLERLLRELAKFSAVGAIGFLVNAVVFNLCVHLLGLAVVRSGVIATAIAIGTNYLGNRHWTYRHCDKNRRSRELTLFLLFSGVGLIIENGALAFSHYGLGYTSALADNVAKNVIGLGTATVFRFWSYRTWVFQALPLPETAPDVESSLTANGTAPVEAPYER